MNYVLPTLRTQRTVLEGIKGRLRDDNSRWTDEEVYRAISDAMSEWSGRVFVPYIYTITGGFVGRQSIYALPSYIPQDIQPQRLIARRWPTVDDVASSESTDYVWADLHAWTLEPDGAGGQRLRIEISSAPYNSVGARVLWWGQNGAVPEEVQYLSADIEADAATLTVAGVPSVPRCGYIKVDDEWMQYAGYTTSGTTMTLQNLVRGVDGGAAVHAADTEVFWGVAAPDDRLWAQLNNQIRAHLHELLMPSSQIQETQQHQWQMRWNAQKAAEFWATWAPNRPMRMKLTRQGTGNIIR